jgi:hypothetical protein
LVVSQTLQFDIDISSLFGVLDPRTNEVVFNSFIKGVSGSQLVSQIKDMKGYFLTTDSERVKSVKSHFQGWELKWISYESDVTTLTANFVLLAKCAAKFKGEIYGEWTTSLSFCEGHIRRLITDGPIRIWFKEESKEFIREMGSKLINIPGADYELAFGEGKTVPIKIVISKLFNMVKYTIHAGTLTFAGGTLRRNSQYFGISTTKIVKHIDGAILEELPVAPDCSPFDIPLPPKAWM